VWVALALACAYVAAGFVLADVVTADGTIAQAFRGRGGADDAGRTR
jgi:hypothetical protein